MTQSQSEMARRRYQNALSEDSRVLRMRIAALNEELEYTIQDDQLEALNHIRHTYQLALEALQYGKSALFMKSRDLEHVD